MDNTTKFIRKVASMRRSQKAYFARRTQANLQKAMLDERDVDIMLEEMGFEAVKAQQLKLEQASARSMDEEKALYHVDGNLHGTKI
jgi:capsular polysaccharide biosynthesis protein